MSAHIHTSSERTDSSISTTFRSSRPSPARPSPGAETESTLRANASAFADVTLWPRVLVDVRDVDTSTSAPAIGLGRKLRTPLLVAPVAMQSMAHPDGERAAVRACASRGVPYCAAQQATTSVERIARACEGGGIGDGGGARMWFQLYVRCVLYTGSHTTAIAW